MIHKFNIVDYKLRALPIYFDEGRYITSLYLSTDNITNTQFLKLCFLRGIEYDHEKKYIVMNSKDDVIRFFEIFKRVCEYDISNKTRICFNRC